MHGAAVAQVFGCAGAVLAVGLNAPQAWTSVVGRRVAGLSPAARWLAVAQSTTWLAYGVVEGVPLQLLTNGICLVLHVSVLAALLALDPGARTGRVLGPQAAASALWLAAVVTSAGTGVLEVATMAALVGAVAVVPQLWSLARHRGGDSSGVSVPTTALGLVSGLCWAVHGLAAGVPAVVLPSLAGAAAAAWTLALLRPASAGDPRSSPAVLGLRRSVATG